MLLLALLVLPQVTGPREVEVFNGRDLTGWRSLGDARYTVDDGAILGEIGGGGQSFLVTEESFGDFVLEVDVKAELLGNSGIQIRSHQRENGRVFGYQIEIDSTERAWSGGLYDEARRGWLQDLEGRNEARAAFQVGEWNTYRIECRGPWIRTWVNGVAITDYLDPLDMQGFIGLQVHSGNDTRVRWARFELIDHGRHEWRPVDDAPRADEQGNFALRWRFDRDDRSVLRVGGAGSDERRAAPGLHVAGASWAVRLHGDPEIDVEAEGLRTAVVLGHGGRVRVFVDGRRVAALDEAGLSRGPIVFEPLGARAPTLEMLVPAGR